MSASERDREAHPRQSSLPQPSAVSMSDLLASCAAASAVSTPPRDKQPAEEYEERRHAA